MAPEPGGDAARLRALLREQFADEVEGVRPLARGTFSRGFAFAAGGREYVVRLSAAPHAAEAFAKDDYAWRHFASPALPIPRVVAIGRTADGHFAIGERVAGRTLDALPPAERRALLPAALDTLDAIARTDVRASRGYGPWDGAGRGRFATWRDFLAARGQIEDAGFGRDVPALGRHPAAEREVHEAGYRRMLQLAAHCPEEHALLHRDYNFANILTDGRRITGVIDWAQACYGDPLYDVAWLGWWTAGGPPSQRGARYDAALVHARYGAAPRYAERIACYECRLALDDLRFYAATGGRTQYEWTRNWLLALIAGETGGA